MPPQTPPTDVLFQQFALIGHAVSSPHRLRLLNLLIQAPRTVEDLADAIGQSVASTSAHLKVLRSACLVSARKQGRFVIYSLAAESVMHFWLALRSLGEELMPEAREVIRAYFDDPESLVRLTPQELLAQARHGQVTVLDLRSPEEFAAGHLPGARSLPFETLRQQLKTLPRRGKLVAYCRGPYCVTAVEAVRTLRQEGLRAYRSPLGVAELKAGGVALSMVHPA